MESQKLLKQLHIKSCAALGRDKREDENSLIEHSFNLANPKHNPKRSHLSLKDPNNSLNMYHLYQINTKYHI